MGTVTEPLLAADAARCAELERMLFTEDSPWPAVAFEQELAAGHNTYRAVRDDDGTVIGYAGIAVLGGETECEIHTVAVDPSHQRRGIGRLLLADLLAVADSCAGGVGAPVFLEVRCDNDAALELYRAHGFSVTGVRRRYYQPSGADAYSMHRPARGEQQ